MIMPIPTPSSFLPRELVLASAGTGKTFRISSRIIGLLASGSRPDSIFASTFTRKAAGEILDRVLSRLADAALNPAAAAELAVHAALAAPPALAPGVNDLSDSDAWLRLLRQVTSDLHRLNIGTLDAFFVRAATSFADEIDLPPGWALADRPTADRVRAQALHEVLQHADPGEVLELVRAIEGKDAARSVHDALLGREESLLAIHHALDPDAAEVWSAFDTLATSVPFDLAEQRARIADAIATTVPPLTGKGLPDTRWVRALATLAEAVRRGDWKNFLDQTICENARGEAPTFFRVEISGELLQCIDDACSLAREDLGRRLSAQSHAMARLAEHFASAMELAQRELGAYEFGDITRLIGGPDAVCDRPDLFYRLDGCIHHVLLDEFQDTSLTQWEALQPLLDGLLARPAARGAAVVVADPKQSIYGWRGGEPLLVRHVGDRYDLERDQLSLSRRSSPVVLELVNHVFAEVETNAVFHDNPAARAAAADWKESFATHQAAKAELRGHVRVVVGPRDEGRSATWPELCRRAAELVAKLRAQAPGRSIGVLVRTNPTVARMMLELRNLGVPASEEGGNPLTDSPAVSALCSLLRLADHPGDRVARYHVAQTPLGELVGLRDHRDDASAREVAHMLRTRLLDLGYGRTLDAMVRQLGSACEPRDRRRLAQLVEMGFRYDARATLRTTDFVRLVHTERVEDPTTADVRVMTVHQSKGLEFDVVVLPELDQPLIRSRNEPSVFRPDSAGRITRVFPPMSEKVRELFPDLPELHQAVSQREAAQWRDALSGLYVALTRARHAVHVVIRADGEKRSRAKTGALLVRNALGADGLISEGEVLFESGDPHWFDLPRDVRTAEAPAAAPVVKLRAGGRPERSLARITPSSLGHGNLVNLSSLMLLDRPAADRGTLAHAWFEKIRWIEDGAPSDDVLREIARTAAPTLDADAVELVRLHFRSWLASADVRYLLARASYPVGATVEREIPFLQRTDGRLMEGVIDRLVLIRDRTGVVGASILDYKTDTLPRGDAAALAARAAQYRPQLEAYRSAVCSWYSLPAASVRAHLVFLESATVIEV